MAVLTNFEGLAITDALADDIDLTTWGFNAITLDVADMSAGEISMDSGSTITIADDTGVATGIIGALVIGASDAGSNDDVVNVAFESDYDGADSVIASVSVDFVETVNFTVTDTEATTEGTGTMTLGLISDDRVETINVTSDQESIVAGTSFAALNTVNASASTGDFTITVLGATQGVTVTSGSGDDMITGSAFGDVISTGDGEDTIVGSAGPDQLTGGADADIFDFSTAVSTAAAMSSIQDFAATEDDADQVTTVGGAVEADTADVNVSAADDDIGVVTADIADGVLTVSGADAANIDSLSEWIAVAGLAAADDAAAGVLAFEFGGDTYVYDSDAAGDTAAGNIVSLVGVTGVAAVDTTAAADTILIA